MSSLVPRISGDWLVGSATGLSPEDQAALERAIDDLERKTWATRVTMILRNQLGVVGVIIPAQFSAIANNVAETAVRAAFLVALRSLNGRPIRDRSRFHRRLAALAGGAGGALGLSGLALELPITTGIILRSIADIARSEGEDITDPATALACVSVLGLVGSDVDGQDGRSQRDTILETSYFATRAILARTVSEAARFLVGHGAGIETAPALVRLVSQIASRFGVAASQKFAVQTIPLIGAAAGAAINYAFIDHFQTIARGHFTILRLERQYGVATVRAEYERLLQKAAT
jgi:hypothetical protein